MRRLVGKTAGALYIDVLMALLVIAAAGFMVFGLLIMHKQTSKDNEYYAIADQIARLEIETIRSEHGYTLSNCTNAALVSGGPQLSLLPSGAGKLTIASSALVSGGKDITVVISWQAENGPARSVTFNTLVSANGPNP